MCCLPLKSSILPRLSGCIICLSITTFIYKHDTSDQSMLVSSILSQIPLIAKSFLMVSPLHLECSFSSSLPIQHKLIFSKYPQHSYFLIAFQILFVHYSLLFACYSLFQVCMFCFLVSSLIIDDSLWVHRGSLYESLLLYIFEIFYNKTLKINYKRYLSIYKVFFQFLGFSLPSTVRLDELVCL